MASNDKAKTQKDAKPDDAAPNKAQAEFEKYMKRMQAQGGVPGFMMPSGEVVPGWAVPPSVAMMTGSAGGFTQPASSAGSALGDTLGSTLRLGVDVINAMLAGSVRFLEGVSGAAYGGSGYSADGCGCGGGCGCNDCCGASCCGTSCCECDCCQPSVGTCC
jgi:hypothetical protein